MCCHSTGKRRYGHPALTGVLPQPWLPIKKGQSLANSVDRDGSGRGRGDQAVVLTLRKRYSAVRKDVRDFANKSQSAIGNLWSSPGPSTAAPLSSTPPSGATPLRSDSSDNVSSVSNPWRDRDPDHEDQPTGSRPLTRRSQSQPQPLNHRLSFDHATGVIMLPDDGEWLLQNDDSDSEEGGTSREATQHEAAVNGNEPASTGVVDAASGTEPSGGARYRTYYHHPEKRRQTVPGAFPHSSPRS
jgi:calcium permeable stress-gated cation channel